MTWTTDDSQDLLQPMDVILVHRKWRGWVTEAGHCWSYLISRRIQTITGSPFNHAAIVSTNTRFLYEATDCVRVQDVGKYLSRPDKYGVRILRLEQPPLTGPDILFMESWLNGCVDCDYDWWLIARLRVALAIGGILGAKVFLQDKNPEAWICSELVQQAYDQAGYHLYDGGIMVPGDFATCGRFGKVADMAME